MVLAAALITAFLVAWFGDLPLPGGGTYTIYVRFPEGVEWWYAACPPHVWEEFTSPGQSRGQYISKFLNYKPNGRHAV